MRSRCIDHGCVRSVGVNHDEKIEARSCSIDRGRMRSGGRAEVGFRISHYPFYKVDQTGVGPHIG